MHITLLIISTFLLIVKISIIKCQPWPANELACKDCFDNGPDECKQYLTYCPQQSPADCQSNAYDEVQRSNDEPKCSIDQLGTCCNFIGTVANQTCESCMAYTGCNEFWPGPNICTDPNLTAQQCKENMASAEFYCAYMGKDCCDYLPSS